MENTDKSLIEAHLEGNPTAFNKLVRRHGDSLMGYLMQISGNRQQAEDLFQETFRCVQEKAHTLRGPQFKIWLYTIATRMAINGFHKCIHMRIFSLNQKLNCEGENCQELGAVTAAKSCLDPSKEAIKAEQKEQIRQALELLPARQRVTLVLAYYQGLSYREVAEVMSCSIVTVKRQMYKALRTLAQRLPDVSGVAK